MARCSWQDYFTHLAYVVASRGTCDRARVGAVLVDPVTHHILATGYNGAPPGEPHCDDVGHDMFGGHCRRTVHAEQNALATAPRTDGCWLYVTHAPCAACYALAKAYGVARIVYCEAYRVGKYDSSLPCECCAT